MVFKCQFKLIFQFRLSSSNFLLYYQVTFKIILKSSILKLFFFLFLLINLILSITFQYPDSSGHWLGATDLQTEGTFTWESNKTKANYTNWDRGEPGGHTITNCLMFWTTLPFWHDGDCGYKSPQQQLCERILHGVAQIVQKNNFYLYNVSKQLMQELCFILKLFVQNKQKMKICFDFKNTKQNILMKVKVWCGDEI